MKKRKMPIYLAMMAALALGISPLAAQDEEAVVEEPATEQAAETTADEAEAPAEVEIQDVEEMGAEMGEQTGPADFGEIEATVEEIEALIQLPAQARLGREADEDLENPFNVFQSEQAIETLLGPRPRFVYFPEGVDPMIIPWVREQIVVQEKMSDAATALENARKSRDKRQAERAISILEELQSQYPETSAKNDIDKMMAGARDFIRRLDQGDDIQQVQIPESQKELPRWIVSNTKGVMLDRDNPRESLVLIGDYILREGDAIERFPAITVKEILPQKVVYEWEDSEYVVSVQAL